MFGKGFGVEPVPHLFEVSSEQIRKNTLLWNILRRWLAQCTLEALAMLLLYICSCDE